MDRRKHHWIIFLGLALVSGGVVLLALQWLQPKADGGKPSSVTTLQFPERTPDQAQSPSAQELAAVATGAVLRGRVIDAVTRSAIQQFEVQLHRRQYDTEVEPPPRTRSFHSSTGRFEWEEAPVGTWRVAVVAPDHQRFEIEELGIAAGQETHDLLVPLLRGYKVTGRVFDQRSRAGVPEAEIAYMPSGDPWQTRWGEASKQDGAFLLEGVPPGRVTLAVQSQRHLRREVDIVVSEQTSPVEIGLSSGGTISGFLVTTSGARLIGPVALVDQQNFSFTKRTDEVGAFSFGQLPAGRYRIGGGVAWQEIVLGPDELREGVFVTAAPSQGRTVRGTVRGLRPHQMRHTSVALRSQAGSGTTTRTLDEQGSFVVRQVPAGPAVIHVDVLGKRTVVRPIEVSADKDLVVDIEIPAGLRVSGRVTRDGKPVAAGHVWIAPVDRSQGSRHRAVTSDSGTYWIEGVPAGEYRIKTVGGADRSIRISDDTVIDLEEPAVQLGGQVLEKAGTVPIVGAVVYATVLGAGASRVRPNDSSDHFGQFQLTGLEPGDVVLSVYKPGYALFRERIAYTSPIKEMTIRLSPATGVEIKARGASSGEAVRDIEVTETIGDRDLGVIFRLHLDENGAGSLPSGLAGSTLEISSAGRTSVVREWDGQPLDLQLR